MSVYSIVAVVSITLLFGIGAFFVIYLGVLRNGKNKWVAYILGAAAITCLGVITVLKLRGLI